VLADMSAIHPPYLLQNDYLGFYDHCRRWVNPGSSGFGTILPMCERVERTSHGTRRSAQSTSS
jgi:hypothetical protein